MRAILILGILGALAVVFLPGCATKANLEFTDYDGTTFKATSKAGPFGELDTTNQRLGYVWLGDGSGEINVGQDANGLSNAGQVEALKATTDTAKEILPTVLSVIGPAPPRDSAEFPAWLEALRLFTGTDTALFSYLLELLLGG